MHTHEAHTHMYAHPMFVYTRGAHIYASVYVHVCGAYVFTTRPSPSHPALGQPQSMEPVQTQVLAPDP